MADEKRTPHEAKRVMEETLRRAHHAARAAGQENQAQES
jgi:hypothetical protein